jgi:hypothetical protein
MANTGLDECCNDITRLVVAVIIVPSIPILNLLPSPPPTKALTHKETQLKDYNKIYSSLPASMLDKIIVADDTEY